MIGVSRVCTQSGGEHFLMVSRDMVILTKLHGFDRGFGIIWDNRWFY